MKLNSSIENIVKLLRYNNIFENPTAFLVYSITSKESSYTRL